MKRVHEGDNLASEQLLPLMYDELRRIAGSMMASERPGQTLQATALVHEAFMRLVGDGDREWDSRGHFMASAAQAMRRILVDQFRRRASLKRGGGRQRLEDGFDLVIEPPPFDVLALDEALRRLEADDARKGQIVSMRYFAGLTIEQTAACLGTSVGTIEREWRYIRTWLRRELAESGS